MHTIRAVIIDDERYACERLKKLLRPFSQIEVLDCFNEAEPGIKYITENKPDLLFLDVELDNGLSAFDIIDKLDHSVRKPVIILVTAYPHYSIKAIKHEVFDYLVKPVDIDELENTIDRLLIRLLSTPDSVIRKYDMLSEREAKIMHYVLEGRSSEEIAGLLFISRNTVNTHRRNILKKTGARSFFDILKAGNE